MKNTFLPYIILLASVVILSSCCLDDDHVTVENNWPSEEVFQVVEEMPRFPGCEDLPKSERNECSQELMLKWLYSNLIYPQEARENQREGTAVMTFVIDKEGNVIDPRLLRDPGLGMGDEAARLIQLMQDREIIWSPGKQRGTPVSVQFNVPVKFEL